MGHMYFTIQCTIKIIFQLNASWSNCTIKSGIPDACIHLFKSHRQLAFHIVIYTNYSLMNIHNSICHSLRCNPANNNSTAIMIKWLHVLKNALLICTVMSLCIYGEELIIAVFGQRRRQRYVGIFRSIIQIINLQLFFFFSLLLLLLMQGPITIPNYQITNSISILSTSPLSFCCHCVVSTV